MQFFTRIKLLARVLACARAIARNEWRRLGLKVLHIAISRPPKNAFRKRFKWEHKVIY